MMRQILISLDKVEFRQCAADPSTTLFSACSMQIESTRITGLMAPSGTGKSTLLQAIAGRRQPTSGQIIWHPDQDGSPMQHRQIQYLPQDAMASLNPAHRIRFILEESLRSARPDKDRIQIDEMMCGFGVSPELLTRKPRHLSGGEALRICLLRALLARPRVLLLDEPSQHLDPVASKELVALIVSLAHDASLGIVIASHDETLLRIVCDETIELVRLG